MRMRHALAEQRDIPERDRYIEKRRSAMTIKIIADPKQLDALYEECMEEATYKAMAEMKKWGEIYLGITTHHINHYIWKLIYILPDDDEELWKICMKHPQEYYHGIRIRDAAQSIGIDFRKSFTAEKGQRTNFAITDYIQRSTLLNSEQNEIKGIQIEWEEVRVADECVGILLRLQTLTNLLQAEEEGKPQWIKPNVTAVARKKEQKRYGTTLEDSKQEG